MGVGEDSVKRARLGFDSERDMTLPATKWLTSQGLLVKQEFRTPWGICDLVGLQLAPAQVARRLKLGQRSCIGPPHRIALLRLLPTTKAEDTISLAGLSAQIGLPPDRIAEELRRLVERRFIQRRADGSFQSLGAWTPLHRRIVTVELKLSRIEDAIAQARAHLAFATESFVGLPAHIAERFMERGRADELKQIGLGLLSVCQRGARVLIPSRSKPTNVPNAVLQMHCVERFWQSFRDTRA